MLRSLGRRIAKGVRALRPAGSAQAESHVGSSDGPTAIRRRSTAISTQLFGITDVGRLRETNEDAFLISDDGQVMVVADGMGGHAAGEVASRLAVRLVVEHLSRSGRNDCGATEGLLSDALCLAHAGVQSAAQASKEWRGMGATLVAAVLRNGTLHTAHVGDVRCYAHSAGGLRQLTRDHSVVAHLVEDGVIAPEDVRTHPRRHEVLQALGTATDIVPEYHSTVLLDGDSVLLCSDGLWESLTDEEIERVFNDSTDAEATARRLVDQANALGGADNITVVVYHHRAGAGPEEGSNHPPAPAEG